ncbi:hypothetical protein Dimus_029661, partial [Dionaea muscipula]
MGDFSSEMERFTAERENPRISVRKMKLEESCVGDGEIHGRHRAPRIRESSEM